MKGIKKLYFTVILLMISTLQMMAQQKICLLYTSDAADDA